MPADAQVGPESLLVIVRLKKGRSVFDKAVEIVPIEVLEESKIEWP